MEKDTYFQIKYWAKICDKNENISWFSFYILFIDLIIKEWDDSWRINMFFDYNFLNALNRIA